MTTILYYLPATEYVGVTNRGESRIEEHKTNGKDVTDYMIIAEFEDNKEALIIESLLHKMGYLGGNKFTDIRYKSATIEDFERAFDISRRLKWNLRVKNKN